MSCRADPMTISGQLSCPRPGNYLAVSGQSAVAAVTGNRRQPRRHSIEIDVDVTGVDVLTLLVGDGGNGVGNDHANWGDARVECTVATPTEEPTEQPTDEPTATPTKPGKSGLPITGGQLTGLALLAALLVGGGVLIIRRNSHA